MPRAFRVTSVLVLSAYLMGCGGSDSSAPPTGDSVDAARQTAAKVPPPPGVKPPKHAAK